MLAATKNPNRQTLPSAGYLREVRDAQSSLRTLGTRAYGFAGQKQMEATLALAASDSYDKATLMVDSCTKTYALVDHGEYCCFLFDHR